jgi:hypothetical protein
MNWRLYIKRNCHGRLLCFSGLRLIYGLIQSTVSSTRSQAQATVWTPPRQLLLSIPCLSQPSDTADDSSEKVGDFGPVSATCLKITEDVALQIDKCPGYYG